MTLPPATVGTTDEELDAILQRNLLDTSPPEPSAVSAEFIRSLDIILIKTDDGERLAIPRERMQGLENATPEQLVNIQIFDGNDIRWPDLDVDHYLPYLLEGRYSTERWKQGRKQQAAAA
jgi:hypothetical protein